MDKKHSQPRWWILYLTIPLMLLLARWEVNAPFTPREHTVVKLLIVLVIFGFVWLWLDNNGQSLT
jgi:hypothetical protein